MNSVALATKEQTSASVKVAANGWGSHGERVMTAQVQRGSGSISTSPERQEYVTTDGADNDVLQGGQGNDSLSGGLGADIFRFAKGDVGTDMVTDFSKTLGDKVDLSGILQGSAFNALSNLSTYLQLSTDGSGNAVLKVDTYGESNFASPAQTMVFANGATSGLTSVSLATLFDERVFVA